MINFCIGCAQFGMNYGVTNKLGKVDELEVKNIIKFAIENNINFFDTSQAYGNSEEIIGKFIWNFKDAKIINKLKPEKKKSFTEKDIEHWESNFRKSLRNLNKDKLDSFLIHDPNDLKKKGYEILEYWLQSLLDRKLVNRLGVSIYTASDLNNISLNNIKLVQMPISLYDQRLIENNFCKDLSRRGIAIHARSIFFQGLLLANYKQWPRTMSSDFIQHHKNVISLFKQKSLMQISLEFILSCKFIETALVGVTSLRELEEIVSCLDKLKLNSDIDYSNLSWNRESDLDPRLWS